ncbi:MAG: hypothetical protein PVF58_14270 [Candidatus Methanofastidiosia archaeon]|jgi:hypothetical protein
MPRTNGGESGLFGSSNYIEVPANADVYSGGDIVLEDDGNGQVFLSDAGGVGAFFVPYDQTVDDDGDGLNVMRVGQVVFTKFKAACDVGTKVEPSDAAEGEVMAAATDLNVCGIAMENVTDTDQYFAVVII